jgi:hypothetical protein
MPDEMNKERLKAIVEAYGAEARRWPEAEREAASAFVDAFPEIAAPLLQETRALDAALDADAAPTHVNDVLAARIAGSFKRQRAAPDWKPFAALAACALFGLIAGFGAGHSALQAQAPQAVAQLDDDAAGRAAIDAALGMFETDMDDVAGDGG